jgi:hypothetical protein
MRVNFHFLNKVFLMGEMLEEISNGHSLCHKYKVYRKAFPFFTFNQSVYGNPLIKFQASLCPPTGLRTVCPGLDSLQKERLLCVP